MPVVGQEARTLLKTIESNGVITNTASQATVNRILAQRHSKKHYHGNQNSTELVFR